MVKPDKPLHVGDLGTALEATVRDEEGVIVDISTASGLSITFGRVNGTMTTKPGALTTNGTDGKFEYLTADASDLPSAGTYQIQGFCRLAAGREWHGPIEQFTVEKNLA